MTAVLSHGGNERSRLLPDRLANEPVAIVGMGCRLPGGADSPEAFWDLLRGGVGAVTEIPKDRWNLLSFYDPDPGKPGKMYSRWGGFLRQIDLFDAQFFRIAPREAVFMDPQQRLLMEVAWEALEDGGLDVESLSGSDAGVFIGISTHDYADIQSKDVLLGDPYTNTGGALSIAANRISYFYNLRGPSIAVDTACSSSLVAVHLACQCLWHQECSLALAGGVNCILTPEPMIGFSKATMLSRDGHCRSFDARADGYVRGEGAGIVVLKPLSRALADHDRVYALILATGVNQDGHSPGLTVPSLEAQEALLRDVYARAGVRPDRVVYVEAHGTGTPVGDPIEAKAIGKVLGAARPNGEYLRIGSVKTNIGHLEAASGIAGLIKAALTVERRQIPPSLHFSEPNPGIAFEDLRLRVQRELESWPDANGASVVGVNSFGFGGTNAHVALSAAPHPNEDASRTDPGTPPPGSVLVPLSARSPEALRAVASNVRTLLADTTGSSPALVDLCHTAGARRSHHEHRLAVTASSVTHLIDCLDAFAAGEMRAGMSSGRQLVGRRPRVAFVFSGMGPQWWGMGRQLRAEEPVFRAALEACDDRFVRHSGWSLREELDRPATESRMHEAEVAQPAHFALQVGLVALWRSWGVVPDAIVGHSAGEVAAAYAAGISSLEDAVQVIYHRSRLQQRATDAGRMLAVGLSADQARAASSPYRGRVSLAAVNSPRSATLSGDTDALEALARDLGDMGVFARFLDVRVPYHSHHMDPLQTELLASLAALAPTTASTPFYSVVTGDRVDGRELDASYWWSNVRQPVMFSDAAAKIIDAGVDAFVELGPHPVLSRSIVELQDGTDHRAGVLASLRRESDERATMLASLGALYTLGGRVAWNGVTHDAGVLTRWPGYPWQRERYWSESDKTAADRLSIPVHPLLERRLDSANPSWETNLDRPELSYLADHRVHDSVVFPAAGYVECALAAGKEVAGDGPCRLEEIAFEKILTLQAGTVPMMQFVVDPRDGLFRIYGRSRAGESWTLNATGKLSRERAAAPPPVAPSLPQLQRRCRREIDAATCYQALASRGLQYGPAFRGVERLWVGKDEAVGRITCPAGIASDGRDYVFHPAMLDSCFHVLLGAVQEAGDSTFLPVALGAFRLHRPWEGGSLWCHARVSEESPGALEGQFLIFSDGGEVVAEVRGFKCQRVPNPRTAIGRDLDDCLFELTWLPKMLAARGSVRRADHLPRPSKLTAHLASLDATERFQRKQYYEEVEPAIDRLCALYAWEALAQRGFRPRRNQKISLEGLTESLAIPPEQRQNLSRLLEILSQDGFLQSSGAGWRVRRRQVATDTEGAARTIVERYPAYESTIRTLARCGSRLHDILGGQTDALQLLFPEGSLDALFDFYKDAAAAVVYNFLTAEAVREVARALPPGRTLRVLEIGAGTGGTTAHVLSALPRNRSEYLFTDLSNVFISAARQRFRDHPFVDYAILDIEKDPESQRFAPHSFDVILAADVLHATRSLRETLTNVKTLLSSGGMLIAMEFMRPLRFLDVMFGGLEDWWRFADFDLRPSHPWLPESAWRALLAECGFTECGVAVDGEGRWQSSQAVLMARGPRLEACSPSAEPAPGDAAGNWLVFGDAGGCGQELTGALASRGHAVFHVSTGDVYARLDRYRFQIRPESPEDLEALLEAVAAEPGPCRAVVHLWSLDAVTAGEEPGGLDRAQDLCCVSVIHLVQGLSRAAAFDSTRVFLVSRGAQRIGAESAPPSPSPALLWGLGRVVMNEHVRLRCTLVDLDPDAEPVESAPLLRELLADDVEQEIALRGDERFVARAMRLPAPRADGSVRRARAGGRLPPFHLEVSRPGVLESLGLHESGRVKPRSGEVQIQVEAAGLNFRDVMKATGLYPREAPDGQALGDECAGTVVRVGKGVQGFRPGDEVIALGSGCFASRVTAAADHVVRKPPRLSFEQAATAPIAFLTAHYALNHVARLRAGERVLIHSAAGGVGLAALQLARRAGAEIFATAGSPEKRALLKSLGVKHVMDSRSLAFVDETMAATGGEGVDAVLNSLAGEFIPKSLSLLRPTGRFLELGKVDFYQNSKLGLWPFRCGLSFCGIDLAWLLRNRPDRCRELLAEVMRMLAEGSIEPLPVRTFPISEAAAAFRFMAQARQVGKIALSLRGTRPDAIATRPTEKRLIRADASYLITGGLGGFGLAMASWMVDNGARHVVLAGRAGINSDEARQAVTRLTEARVEVVVHKVDVSREDEVARMLAEIGASMPPLRGVLHAAMVLDDGFLLQLDGERLRRVTRPKVNGAWNLHRLTLDRKLDFFVLFSSMASWIGTAGQGSYAAANAFLDALAHHRQARNLPVLTVNWGALSGTGYVARNPEIERDLRRQGMLGLDPAEAGAILGRLLSGERCAVGAGRFDFRAMTPLRASNGVALRFAHLILPMDDAAGGEQDARPRELLTALRSATPETRLPLVESALRGEISRILAIPASHVDPDQPLADLGLDSLMSVELENVIKTTLHIELPLGFLVGEKVSLRQLSQRLLDQSQAGLEPMPEVPTPEKAPVREPIPS